MEPSLRTFYFKTSRFGRLKRLVNYYMPTNFKIWFVPHPYNKSDNGAVICPWNMSGLHRRKLLESHDASVIDASHIKSKDCKITFVGEWECCSEHRPNSKYKTGSKDIYKDIHSPFLTVLDSHPQVLNTDPFVFGDYFYYVCCKVRDDMKPGDIVIIGTFKKDNPYEFIVDTVMVLLGNYEIKENEDKYFPYAYYNVTLSKILPNKKVWIGKMYDNRKHNRNYLEHIYQDLENSYNEIYNKNQKLFSFVPCKRLIEDPNNTQIVTSLPVITVKNSKGDVLKGARNGSHIEVSSASEMKDIFDDIVRQVQTNGFELGVYMPMPTYRELKDIVK